jgi:hypothetical protein
MADSNDTKRASQMALGNNTAAERPQDPQTVVYIDPQNRTGQARDRNTGLTPSDPWLTWASGFLPRFGVSPVLRNSTTINFMSSSPSDGSDPVFFAPIMDNFAALRFNGTFDAHNLAGSGALAGVLAKNRATGQTLTANLSATPSAAVGQVLVNTTAGKQSRCMIRAALGGGVFQLTQPLTIQDNWPTAGDPVEVDTYTNGDTYQIYNEDLMDLVKLDAIVAAFDAVLANEFTVVTNLGVLKPIPASGVAPCYIADVTVFLYSWLQRRVNYLRPAFTRNSIMWGCLGLNGIQGGVVEVPIDPSHGNRPWLMGGAYGTVSCPGAKVDDDVIFTADTRLFGGLIGAACVAPGATLECGDECVLAADSTVAAIWGGGAVNVHFGRLSIQGVTAVASLLNSGGLAIDGQTNGFTATHANPSVVNGAVAITPANIDANASGLFIPGGGAIATF